MGKNARIEKIKQIIETNEIETQDMLAAKLAATGFKVTQATLSRDLKGLNVVKTRGRQGRLVYSLDAKADRTDYATAEAGRMMQSFVTDVTVSENLIVLKTLPGHAQGVAASLDASRFTGILGTVAGDDTILVVTDGLGKGKKVAQVLNTMWTGEKSGRQHGG